MGWPQLDNTLTMTDITQRGSSACLNVTSQEKLHTDNSSTSKIEILAQNIAPEQRSYEMASHSIWGNEAALLDVGLGTILSDMGRREW